MPTIGILVAGVFAVFAASLIPTALAAAIEGNWRVLEAVLLVGASYAFLTAIAGMALLPRRRRLNQSGVFLAAVAVWAAMVAAATPVFVLAEGAGPAEAVFEAASASVTLGLTVRPPQDISIAMGIYRGTIAWMGGLLTLVMAVYVLGPYQVGGTPNAHLRLIQHASTETEPHFKRTLWAVTWPYALLTATCALLLAVLQVPPHDALVVAMSMLATNGFVPHQTGASVLDNMGAEAVMMVFMLAGATSIVWHRLLAERRWAMDREHGEGIMFLAAAFALMVLAILASSLASHDIFEGFGRSFSFAFDAVSAITTTGISHEGAGSSLPLELVLLAIFVGGCSYSTAGGIKVFRLATMLQHLGNELNRLVYPSALLRNDVQHDEKPREIAKAVWSAFFLAILTVTGATLVFAAQGYGLPEASSIAVGAFAQTASVVAEALPDLHSGGVSGATLLAISALGVVARIEILVVLAALAGNRW